MLEVFQQDVEGKTPDNVLKKQKTAKTYFSSISRLAPNSLFTEKGVPSFDEGCSRICTVYSTRGGRGTPRTAHSTLAQPRKIWKKNRGQIKEKPYSLVAWFPTRELGKA